MAEEVHVTTSQADAAKLIVERDLANGKHTAEAIRKIATAQVQPPEEPANRPKTHAVAWGERKRWLRALLARLPWRRAAL